MIKKTIEIFRLMYQETKALKWLAMIGGRYQDRSKYHGIRVEKNHIMAVDGFMMITTPMLEGMEDYSGKHLLVDHVPPAGQAIEVDEGSNEQLIKLEEFVDQIPENWKEVKEDAVIGAGYLSDFIKYLPRNAQVRIVISAKNTVLVFMARDNDGNLRHAFIMPMAQDDRVFYDPYNMEPDTGEVKNND